MTHAITSGYLSTAIVSALIALSALAVYAVLFALGPDWAAYAPASCTATHCFCEATRPGSLVVVPAATWSSFGYALIGYAMIVLAGGRDWASATAPVAAQNRRRTERETPFLQFIV